MGCDVWSNNDLPVLWNWSGSSGNPITITVDKTWYNTNNCSSGWNRPVWDSGNTVLSPNAYFSAAWGGTTAYGVLDNIEMIHLFCSGACSGSQLYVRCYNTCNNWTFSNVYEHAWNIATDGDCTLNTMDGTNDLFTNGVIDGTDATGASPAGGTCYAFYTALPSITNTVIHGAASGSATNGLANGIVGGPASGVMTLSGNLIYNIIESNAGSHPNCVEMGGGATYYIHDNVIHDCNGETMFNGSGGEVDYVWNNLFYNVLGNAPEYDVRSGTGTVHWWNNTIEVPAATYCLGQTGSGSESGDMTNNHCIVGSGGTLTTTTGLTLKTNLQQSQAQANANSSPHFDQYTLSEAFVFSPLASTNSTVGAGTNLTGSCSGASVGLCSDNLYACTEGTVNGVVQSVCPARTVNPRPSTGAWDIGAYLYGGDSAAAPNPPTGLNASVN
jgi:hypothetical protein